VASSTGQYGLSSCFNKESFTSWVLAERVAKRMRRSHDSATMPYQCKACGRYHVGSDEQRMRHQRRSDRKRKWFKAVRLNRSELPNKRYRLSFWSRLYE